MTTTTTTTTTTKAPRTAYAHFLKDKDVRSDLKDELSDKSATAVSKAMTQKWNSMDETSRKPYLELNIAEKAAWQEAAVNIAVKKAKSKQAKRKRARSAYTLFSMDPVIRNAAQEANPDAGFGGLSKVISAQWKTLTSEEKTPYEEAHLQEKANVAATPVSPVVSSAAPKAKRGRSAYNFYAMDGEVRAAVQKDNSDADFGKLSKLIGERWKGLSEEEKSPYEEKSLADKAQVALAKAKAVEMGVVAPPKVKRARSAYTLYSLDPAVRNPVKKANQDADFGTLSKLISAQWKALSPEDKKPYEEKSGAEKVKVAETKATMAAANGTALPGKTKRARSAYTLYSMDPEVRKAVKVTHPDADFGKLSQLISAQWKDLSAEDRKPYTDKSNGEKAVVAEAKAKNAPKKRRAKTAYLCFSTDPKQRTAAKTALGGEPKVTDIAKHLGAQWKQMSPEDKKPYDEQSAAEKAKLKAEQEAEASEQAPEESEQETSD
jgi:hypothetical protein